MTKKSAYIVNLEQVQVTRLYIEADTEAEAKELALLAHTSPDDWLDTEITAGDVEDTEFR